MALVGEGPAVPQSVLDGLRAIDPRADCVWVPGDSERGPYYEIGVWYEPDKERSRLADIVLERERHKPVERQSPGPLRWAKYVKRGWRPVFGVSGRVPDQRDVSEFRERDWRFRHQMEKELAEREALQDTQRATKDAELKAHIEDFVTDEYPYICRVRSQVPVHGVANRFGSRWDGATQNAPQQESETCQSTSDPK